jgi:glycyl-tRNA synthetase
MEAKTKFEKILDVALKRAIFYPSAEIYPGSAGYYTYGSIGLRIKHNWQNMWRAFFLNEENFHEMESSDIMPSYVFQASGHIKNFIDPIVECSKCGHTERADQILENQLKEKFEGLGIPEFDKLIKKHGIKCEKCEGVLKDVGFTSLMFNAGNRLQEGTNIPTHFLRPETAQGVYVSFKREYLANRERLPLGIAIVGKAFRNEIAPRQGLYRTREFTQAELQIFFNPSTIEKHPDWDSVKDREIHAVFATERKKTNHKHKVSDLIKHNIPKMYAYYLAKVQEFYEKLGFSHGKIRFFQKADEEKAFYNKIHFDVEINVGSLGGFQEVGGIHYRTDFDLTNHQDFSKHSMEVTKDGKKFTPHVIELSFGVDRNIYALLDHTFKEGEFKEGTRRYFTLPPRLAPYPISIFPLVSKDKIDEKAMHVYKFLENFDPWYDDSGSIGRRYARSDEVGIPYGITIDYDTLRDDTVTIRDRDTQKQRRVKIAELPDELYAALEK